MCALEENKLYTAEIEFTTDPANDREAQFCDLSLGAAKSFLIGNRIIAEGPLSGFYISEFETKGNPLLAKADKSLPKVKWSLTEAAGDVVLLGGVEVKDSNQPHRWYVTKCDTCEIEGGIRYVIIGESKDTAVTSGGNRSQVGV